MSPQKKDSRMAKSSAAETGSTQGHSPKKISADISRLFAAKMKNAKDTQARRFCRVRLYARMVREKSAVASSPEPRLNSFSPSRPKSVQSSCSSAKTAGMKKSASAIKHVSCLFIVFT